jgi:hypothetical protein
MFYYNNLSLYKFDTAHRKNILKKTYSLSYVFFFNSFNGLDDLTLLCLKSIVYV